MRKFTLLLFGAGASAFCGPTEPERPPLGTGLYDDMVRNKFISRFFDERFGDMFRSDFESAMARISRTQDLYTYLTRQMGKYFLRFRIGKGNAYSTLIDAMPKDEWWHSATLNYDNLLDQALAAAGRVRPEFAFMWLGGIPLCRLHGSWTMIPRGTTATGNLLFCSPEAFSAHAVYEPDPAAVMAWIREQEAMKDSNLGPALSFYAPGKETPFCGHAVEIERRRFLD